MSPIRTPSSRIRSRFLRSLCLTSVQSSLSALTLVRPLVSACLSRMLDSTSSTAGSSFCSGSSKKTVGIRALGGMVVVVEG